MEISGFLLVFVIIFLIIVIITLIVGVYYLYNQLRSSEKKIQDILLKHQREIVQARQESVAVSRNVIKGQIAEQIAPLLSGFPYLPSDSHFIGMPIDYLIFRGYTELKDSHKLSDDFEIVIADVKYNTARLSLIQEAIKNAVQQGRVKFETVRILTDGKVKIDTWGITKKEIILEDDSKKLITTDQRLKILKIVEKYPNAYKTWTTKDDDLLKEKFEAGLSIKELVVLFQRQSGAIRSRLRKKKLIT